MPNVPQIISQAIQDSNVHLCTHVPGFGGTETFAALKTKYFTSFHEEVAYAVALGCALNGKRSACFIKTHGLLKAANAVVNSLQSGTKAGFVTFIFDDPASKHSDNILNTEKIIEGLDLPFLKPEPNELYSCVQSAFELSEQRQLPYFILVNCDQLQNELPEPTRKILPEVTSFPKRMYEHLICPPTADYQHQVLNLKLTGHETEEVVFPKPINDVPNCLPPGAYEAALQYEPFFKVFKKYRPEFVAGDTSLSSMYAFGPYSCVDAVLYMGGSVPLAIGALAAGKEAWALTGDFSFVAAGHLGLLEAKRRKLPLKLVIFNNGKAAATGGQPVEENFLDALLQPYGDQVIYLNSPYDEKQIEQALLQAQESEETSIILVRGFKE